MVRGVAGDVQHLRPKRSKCDQLVSCCSLLTVVTCSILALVFLIALIILTTNQDYCRNAVSSRLKAGRNSPKESSLVDPAASAMSEADCLNCSRACVGVLMENGSVIHLPSEYLVNASSTWKNASFGNQSRPIRVLGTKLYLKLFKHNSSSQLAQLKTSQNHLLSFSSKLNYSVVHILCDFDHEDEMKTITVNINEEFLSIVFSMGVVLFILL